MGNIKYKSIIKPKPLNVKFFDHLEKELLKHGVVKILGFGVFKLKNMKGRSCFIVGANKLGRVEARTKILFRPTSKLQINIQQYGKKS